MTTTFSPGDHLDDENFIDVPPGSVVTDGYDDWTVLNHGYAHKVGVSSTTPMFQMGRGGYRIKSLGDWPVLQENLFAFKQRVRTVCWGSARENSVPLAPVQRALEQIEANDEHPPLGIGMFVHWGDGDLRERLRSAAGVVLGTGEPNIWDSYSEVDPSTERTRLGAVRGMSRLLRVHHLNNPQTDQYLTPPTPEEVEEIARLKGVIWRIGSEAKAQERWCPAYETAVGSLGISPASVTTVTATAPEVEAIEVQRRHLPVPFLSTDETAALPVGAVLEWGGDADHHADYDGDWNWVRRTDGPAGTDIPTRTRNFIGPNGGSWGSAGMRCLWDGTGQMLIPITRGLMQHLPVGTRLGTRFNPTANLYERRTVGNDRDWASRESGTTVRGSDFFSGSSDRTDWVIVALPDRFEYRGNPAGGVDQQQVHPF